MNKYIVAVIVLIILAISLKFLPAPNKKSQEKLINTITYSCDNDKKIAAAYYEGGTMPKPKPGEMPKPTGSVIVSINGAASTTLKQTISADGIRYANGDESLVFWSKGDEALIMKNNEMDLDYRNCKSI